MVDKKEKLMYNEAEISMIKELFADNEYLLKVLRRLFWGIDISKEDKDLILKTFKRDGSKEVLKRKFYGELDVETPIGQLSDFWMGVEGQVFGASRDTIEQAITSKVMVLENFNKAFALLSNPDGEKPNMSVMSLVSDPLQSSMIARNIYLKAVETALFTIKTIAGKKEESLEETIKRISQDSAK